jgi:hypothetical protein
MFRPSLDLLEKSQKGPERVSALFDETNLGLKCGKNKAISMMFQHGLHALRSWLTVFIV